MFVIPQFALDPSDVKDFLDELRGFHTAFRDGFARSEPRDHFFHDMVGQFSELERKSIGPMARQVEGGNVRAMQRCISDAVWNDAQLLRTYHRLVHEDMGSPDGVVIVDESGFPKKGQDSAGVARQHCGALGKAAVLPLKTWTIADVLQLVAGIQERNHRAFVSHRKRRMQGAPG